MLYKDLKMAPFKHSKKQQLSAKIVDKCFERAQILLSHNQGGMLPNLVFSDKTTLTPKMIAFGHEMGMKDLKWSLRNKVLHQ